MTPDFWGALARWLLKGCKTNFLKSEWVGDKEAGNTIIGIIVAILLIQFTLMKSLLSNYSSFKRMT